MVFDLMPSVYLPFATNLRVHQAHILPLLEEGHFGIWISLHSFSLIVFVVVCLIGNSWSQLKYLTIVGNFC